MSFHLTLAHDSLALKKLSTFDGVRLLSEMISPNLECTKWFREMNIPLRYERVWYTPRGDLRQSQVSGLRFEFRNEQDLMMFKLAWGGA